MPRTALTVLILAIILPLSGHAQPQIQVGYSILTPDAGDSAPVGSALFSYTNATGVLISQAGVAATEPIRSGRIYVDEAGTHTALALANPSPADAAITLTLRDASGSELFSRPITLGARQHLARYVSELFANLPSSLTGSLTFDSDQPLAAITLRESRNALNEPLYTTLPVVNLNAAVNSQPVVFPHIAAGGGYVTQLLLFNGRSETLRGRVRLIASDGQDLLLRLNGNTVPGFDYQISPHGSYRAELDAVSGPAVGYAIVTPDAGSSTPAGTAIFQYKPAGSLMTEAAVAATAATTTARIFVDYLGTQTGFAIANPSDVPAELTLTRMDRFGFAEEQLPLQVLSPRSHMSRFVQELFPSVTNGYSGLLEIRSSQPIVVVTLKLTTNSRGDLVLTTLPVADLARGPSANQLVFPQITIGPGFSTRLILINSTTNTASRGLLFFRQSDGTDMVLPMSGQTASQFGFQLVQGGGRQLYPGNGVRVSSVFVLDPSSERATSELVINEGNTVRPRLRVIDALGAVRDDFDATITSLDPTIASVDALGSIQGRKLGFSTLSIVAGGVLTTATATVVRVDAGVAGFEATGIAQDLARRLYLASASDHTVLLAQDLKQVPQLYAGISRTSGLKDDIRPQSLFNLPAFLTLNQAEGSLYVSDAANNAIRRIRGGPAGRVETVAGNGSAGNKDGAVREALFNNPQGIALDNRGNLWIADSGNHTIRRINLSRGTVETIAGTAGLSGTSDGKGAAARFNSPTGIAVEAETAIQQLARQARGLPPPAVRILVADTGNGLLRRVKETGEVETIPTTQPISSQLSKLVPLRFGERGQKPAEGQTLTITGPFGVAVDSAGTIFVTDSLQQVNAILPNGEVVRAVQPGTFTNPKGIVIAQNGKVVVAAKGTSVREIAYGQPQISSLSPNQVGNSGGQPMTIKGSNFSADTLLVIGGTVISDHTVSDTQTITFKVPPLPSGRNTLTVANRGGSAQTSVIVDPVPLTQLNTSYITTVAGGSTYAGEGASALAASIHPVSLAVDPNGNLFIADQANRKVRRVDSRTGILTTVAGNGQDNRFGENGPAVAAGVSDPHGVVFDLNGNLLILDSGIRKVDAINGMISTVFSTEFCGDGGNAIDNCANYITGFTVDNDGSIFISDYYNHNVRRIDGRTNVVTTVAGNGQPGLAGDGGEARFASLNFPYAVVVDSLRRLLYIADAGNNRVRRVDLATNLITTVAGGGSDLNGVGDNQPATMASLNSPTGLAIDSAGNVLISDPGHARIRKLDIESGLITTVVGSGRIGDEGDGGPAVLASLRDPFGLAVDAAGNIWVADDYAYIVRKVDAQTQVITTVAGNRKQVVLDDNGPATAATLRSPSGIALSRDGSLYITDAGNHRIRKLDAATGLISTIAGGGLPPTGIGDGGPATSAVLANPRGRVAIDPAGNIYVADRYNYAVRKIDSDTRIITTIAGNQHDDSSGDGGRATEAGVLPDDVALDRRGNLYIAEGETRRIRKVNLVTGIITNVTSQALGLGSSLRITVDRDDNLYIADLENGLVRRIDAISGIITTIAGGGSSYADNQPAKSVSLLPMALDVDVAGNLYILDRGYPTGIRVLAATGLIRTVAGTDRLELGDNGPAIAATFYYPLDIAVDASGNVFIADTDNHRIRAIRGPIP